VCEYQEKKGKERRNPNKGEIPRSLCPTGRGKKRTQKKGDLKKRILEKVLRKKKKGPGEGRMKERGRFLPRKEIIKQDISLLKIG